MSLPADRLPPNRSAPPGVIIPELAYSDVVAAARWLCATFGFTERLRIGDHRIQLVFGGAGVVAVGASPPAEPGRAVLVRIADVAAHCAHARRGGATIVREPADYPYGERQYTVADLAGYHWTFSQTIADVDPAEWGGVLVDPA
jgi:uncharacterized glyoxalase superfamily protein PhnB